MPKITRLELGFCKSKMVQFFLTYSVYIYLLCVDLDSYSWLNVYIIYFAQIRG